MKWRMIIPAAVAFAIGAGAHGDVLQAANKLDFDKDVAAMLRAKVTLAEAIATAEKEAGGKAINAGVDNENGTIFIGVAVALGEKVQKVLIDPQTGKVVKITAKDEDGENGEQPDE